MGWDGHERVFLRSAHKRVVLASVVATWAILLAAGLYLLTAVDLWAKGQHGLAFAFLCYALANGGLCWAAWKNVPNI